MRTAAHEATGRLPRLPRLHAGYRRRAGGLPVRAGGRGARAGPTRGRRALGLAGGRPAGARGDLRLLPMVLRPPDPPNTLTPPRSTCPGRPFVGNLQYHLQAVEADRKNVVEEKSLSVRVDLGGRRTTKK